MSHYNLSEGALVGEDIRLWEAVETLMCGFLPCREQNDFFFLLGRASLSHGKDVSWGFYSCGWKQHTLLPLLENLNPKK